MHRVITLRITTHTADTGTVTTIATGMIIFVVAGTMTGTVVGIVDDASPKV
jgi:hypothetical protein